MIGSALIYPTITYSRWFPRSGDAATFAVEVIGSADAMSNGDFKITIETKNSEDDDVIPGGQQTAFSTIALPTSGSGVTQTTLTRADGLLELVRFKFHWNGEEPSAGDFVHFRMLPPMWEFN